MPHRIQLQRYEEIIKNVINNALKNEVNNKMAKYATVTFVTLTNDLSFAKIHIDCLNHNNIKTIIENLNLVKGFLRTKVSSALDLYKTPQLIFCEDTTITYVQKIDELLDKINKKDE